jgi:hypothetical protein
MKAGSRNSEWIDKGKFISPVFEALIFSPVSGSFTAAGTGSFVANGVKVLIYEYERKNT